MRFRVPTDNPLKVRAVGRALERLGRRDRVERVAPARRPSQPRGWRETVRLARTRAERAGPGGVGLESGVVRIPGAGSVNAVVCAIWDGRCMHVGLGPSFQLPPELARPVRRRELGGIVDRVSGRKGTKQRHGAIGFLSGGRVRRIELLEQASLMALVSWLRCTTSGPGLE